MKWKDVKKEIAADPDVAQALQETEVKYQIIRQILASRLENKMTQKELAQRVSTQQANIARLKSGTSNPINLIFKASR